MKDEKQPRLTVVPMSLRDANDFVTRFHRHHKKSQGHKFSLGVRDEGGQIRGVAIVGRPVARMLDNGTTLEVVRLATDGCDNACSALYGAARRVAREMGYKRILTYILESEPGLSLKAAGWTKYGKAGGGSWDRADRPRIDKHPTEVKVRYEVNFGSN